MKRWKGQDVILEPSPGGRFRARLNDRAIARGEFVEVDPPHRVVFTWGWEGEGHPVQPGSSTVEVTLTPDGDGTLVRLVHSGLPSDEERKNHASGWDHYLSRLVAAAEGGDPGPDPNAAQG